MRVKSPRRQRHNRVLARTRGFRMSKHRLYKVAREADIHAGQYAFAGRKRRKRDFRRLWITRISAALMPFKISYSTFIHSLKQKQISLDRKILSELAISDPDSFKAILESSK